MDTRRVKTGTSVTTRRTIAYIVLALITFMCLFWFYILFINATRSHSDLTKGFTLIPGGNVLENWNNLMHSTQPVISGMKNSLIIAICAAALSTYFSTMTAYAIHAYEFKIKNAMFTFILAVMMIPTQVVALGFIELMRKMKLMDTFTPLIIPAIAAPATFFYMKQYMESALPMALLEAARIDGSGEFRTFNSRKTIPDKYCSTFSSSIVANESGINDIELAIS